MTSGEGTKVDEALEELEQYAPEFAGRLSNHGPMVVETLAMLDRHDAIEPWLRSYTPNLEARWTSKEPVDHANWRAALGDKARYEDWREFFKREVDREPWGQVVGRWAGLLAPGLSGSATHGIIRTGHAVRNLEVHETPQRLRELSDALAYWASVFQLLPEAPSRLRVNLESALQMLPELPLEQQARAGWERRVIETPSFAGAIHWIDFTTAGDALSDLTEAFARIFLRNSALRGRVVIPIHSVTSAAAARKLLPYVNDDTAGRLVRYVWQAGAAICTAYAADRHLVDVMESQHDWDDLTDQAISTGDEHAIKFVEACKSEYSLLASPCFLEAAADACLRLARSS